jgi:hypothetical protein
MYLKAAKEHNDDDRYALKGRLKVFEIQADIY